MSTTATTPAPASSAPVKSVTMTPSTQTRGVPIGADVLYLDDIPKAMDHMGWTVSAKLMRRWFATKPAWEMPVTWRNGHGVNYSNLPSSQLDDQIVKMKWLLGFDRAASAFERLCQEWNSPAAINVLKAERLVPRGWTAGATTKLGQGIRHAHELDTSCQVNIQPFGDYRDTFDDLYGSLFKATLKLAVVGKASRSLFSKRDIFEIEKVGVYVRDTYDFNSDWFDDALFGLGVWNKERLLSKKELAQFKTVPLPLRQKVFPGFVPVRNEDFRSWQKDRNDGGDFFVFSDVIWLPPHVEYVFL